jgi:hypothetical protein
MPCAGGTADAQKIPRTPLSTSKVRPVFEKPAPTQKTAKRSMERMNMDLRPKRSATLPKNRRSAPEDSEEAAFIQVISAVVIFKSLPANEDITVTEPTRKEDIATAIVTERTKRHSWSVDLKHSGRASGSRMMIGGDLLPSSGS